MVEETVGDDKTVIGEKILHIDVPPETPREKEVRDVSNRACQQALDRLEQADSLTDYLRWHRAASVYFIPRNIDWIWDYGGTTPQDLVAEQENPNFTKGSAQNAAIVEEMRPIIEEMEPKEGQVRVTLKRVKNYAGLYEYIVLAAFPERTTEDPLDGKLGEYQKRTGVDILFFEPENACVNHACADLFKQHRTDGFYMPFKPLAEAIRQLQSNQGGVNEYLLYKTETGKVTQDAQNYILVGLLGGYSNERYRVRVSDFWNKAKVEV